MEQDSHQQLQMLSSYSDSSDDEDDVRLDLQNNNDQIKQMRKSKIRVKSVIRVRPRQESVSRRGGDSRQGRSGDAYL